MITKNYLFMLFIIHVYIDNVFCFGIATTCCYSYAKIVSTTCTYACYTCLVRHVLTLVYFYYLDKNPGWVTDDYGYDDFPEDY